MMCCQEYMRVASSDILIVRCRQISPFLSECLSLVVCVTPTDGSLAVKATIGNER